MNLKLIYINQYFNRLQRSKGYKKASITGLIFPFGTISDKKRYIEAIFQRLKQPSIQGEYTI